MPQPLLRRGSFSGSSRPSKYSCYQPFCNQKTLHTTLHYIIHKYMLPLGQTRFELKAHFKKAYDSADMEEHWHLIIMADAEIPMAKPLLDLIAIDELPFVTWSDDPERLDQYPDGTADIARTTNKLLNSNISSLAENGILRNLGMNFYDSSIEGFVPQTYESQPFGWYGIPVPENKKIDEVFKKIEIPAAGEKIQEMEFVKKLVEVAVAANTMVQDGNEKTKSY